MAVLDLPLLRSCLRLGGEADADLLANLTAIRSEVVPEGIDAHLLTFIGSLADRSGRVPDLGLVEHHYQALVLQSDVHGHTGLTRLSEIRAFTPPFLAGPDFRYALDQFKRRVLGDGLGIVLQQAGTILTGSLTQPQRGKPPLTLQGPQDAIAFVEAGLTNLTSQFRSGDIEGEFRQEVDAALQQYLQRKATPGAAIGVKSGFLEIDQHHDGLARGDLALVLGFTSHFKSTICMNWAYRAAVWYGQHVAILSMEMSVKTLLTRFIVMHSTHRKFEQQFGFTSLTYDAVRRGQLTPDQEALFEAAARDLQTCPDYGRLLYKEPDRALTVGDIRRWAEQQHRKVPLDLLVIDYLGLVNPTSGGSSLKESAILNAAMADAKKMAQTFANGRGVAVLSPFQANREGLKDAEKNGGRYNLRALAWANEAERSSDLVYSIYVDEAMREAHEAVMGNLKARDRKVITELFKVFCDPETGVIESLDPTSLHQTPVPALTHAGAQP